MTGIAEERHRRRREAKTVGRFEPGGSLASIVGFVQDAAETLLAS